MASEQLPGGPPGPDEWAACEKRLPRDPWQRPGGGRHLGVEAIDPSISSERINQAGPERTLVRRAEACAKRILDRIGLRALARSPRKSGPSGLARRRPPGNRRYATRVSPELREPLLRVTVPEVAKLEKLLGIDLTHWKR